MPFYPNSISKKDDKMFAPERMEFQRHKGKYSGQFPEKRNFLSGRCRGPHPFFGSLCDDSAHPIVHFDCDNYQDLEANSDISRVFYFVYIISKLVLSYSASFTNGPDRSIRRAVPWVSQVDK